MDAAIARIATRQLGLIARAQLLALGLTSEQIWRLISRGRIERIHPGVYRITGYPPSWDQQLLAALLAAGGGSAISFKAAGRFWNLDAVRSEGPEVTVVHAQVARLAGVTVHRTRLFAPGDVLRKDPLRVTSPYRTLIDLAAVLAVDSLEDALDDAIRRNLVSVKALTRRLEVRGRRGVRGIANLARLLEERTGQRKKASRLQNMFRRGLLAAKIPMPIEEHPVFDANGRFIARVDFAYPDKKVYLEVDGSHHETRKQREDDIKRQNRLSDAGWRPMRYSNTQIRAKTYVAEIAGLFRNG